MNTVVVKRLAVVWILLVAVIGMASCDGQGRTIKQDGISFEVPNGWKSEKTTYSTAYSDKSDNPGVIMFISTADKEEIILDTLEAQMETDIETAYDIAKGKSMEISEEALEIDGVTATVLNSSLIIDTESDPGINKKLFFIHNGIYYNITFYIDDKPSEEIGTNIIKSIKFL